MKKILIVLSFILFTNLNAQAMGLFYTNATYPITATGAKVKDLSTLKKGSASANSILFCVEIGDASIDKAAKNAGITKITHIDVHQKSIFIFWSKTTVNVYGE
ncbi:TRL-like family protein [bacterium]|nr:TRL-like family protein [bacterium]